MTDAERYQELLDLLGRGIIRYAEKRGQLESVPVQGVESKANLLDEKELKNE